MPIPKMPVWAWMQISFVIAMFLLSLWISSYLWHAGSPDYCRYSSSALCRRNDALLLVDAISPASLIIRLLQIVGSRTGAMLRRLGLAVALRFL
jgi:hypothetical protein